MCNLFYLFIIAPQSSPTTLCPPRQMWLNVRCQYRERQQFHHLSIRAQLSHCATTNCTQYVRGIILHLARSASSAPSMPCRILRDQTLCGYMPAVLEMVPILTPRPQRDRIQSTKIGMLYGSSRRYWPYLLWCRSRPRPERLSACRAPRISAPCCLQL